MNNPNPTTNILEKIIQKKQEEVAITRKAHSREFWQEQIKLLPAPLPFAQILRDAVADNGCAVIAEIKKASPSQGLICKNFDPITIAKDYQAHGANALSVLTDKSFFMGSLEHLKAVRGVVKLPLLQKDFIIDSIQILQARTFAADAILLIVAALNDYDLQSLWQCAIDLGLTVLLEVHNGAELERALILPLNANTLIGVNNRNLKTFAVSLDTIVELKPKIPETQIGICESGIHHAKDLALMTAHDINVFLIGESFMRSPSPGIALQQLFQEGRPT